MVLSDPSTRSALDSRALARRSQRNVLDPFRPWAFFTEQERDTSGKIVDMATVFLTNRECPWRCVMCDLWKNTLEKTVPPGAIPMQIDRALESMEQNPALRIRQLKLYNSGSFFDAAAIPREDHPAIAARASRFERLIVECHPALVNERVLAFRDLLGESCQMEIAMGLETAHPETLEKLNKRMTLDKFAGAARWLMEHGIDTRAFILVQPPFLQASEARHWTERSIDFALDCGVGVVSLIPTRSSWKAMQDLEHSGQFTQPRLSMLEATHDYGMNLGRGRVLADLWDLERFKKCEDCFANRRDRLQAMNLQQCRLPRVSCIRCGGLS